MLQIQVRCRVTGQLLRLESVKTNQPVGLVKPMFAHERRCDQRQLAGRTRNGTEGGVINAAQFEFRIQGRGTVQDRLVSGIRGANDHLRALSRRGESRAARALLSLFVAGIDAVLDRAHRALNAFEVFFRRELRQVSGPRQFDVDADAIGVLARFIDERLRRFGNGLQVDVAFELVFEPQFARNRDDLLHGVVGIANDA